jgi:hypothetical protein
MASDKAIGVGQIQRSAVVNAVFHIRHAQKVRGKSRKASEFSARPVIWTKKIPAPEVRGFQAIGMAYLWTSRTAPFTSVFRLATLAAPLQEPALAVLEAALQQLAGALSQEAAFVWEHCSPACSEVIVAKAANARQTRSFCIYVVSQLSLVTAPMIQPSVARVKVDRRPVRPVPERGVHAASLFAHALGSPPAEAD